MVKADAKRDYYADLDLPPTAEHEEIKKQFRLLAKLYHPDRNPGHETEFVSKFQALQAAHEILCDPSEKQKYDVARAKYVARNPPPPKANTDVYGFSKPNRASTMNFPPPPTTNKSKPSRGYTYAQETPASAGAAKFNAFTRAGNQTWDRQRFEEAARAEAARGFSQMRSGQQTPEMPPRPPPRPHPTAPRSATADTANGANPGFPGMSRTASARRTAYEEVHRSAYSHVRGNRGNPAQTPADHWTAQSPPQTRTSDSPLRHTKSSEPPESATRPGMFDRQPSRYASTAHVKTNIKEGLHRSSSVRNSPIDPQWEDSDAGPFGRPRSHQQPPPRHRSASPSMRATSGGTADFSETDSGSSSDDAIHLASRKKAQPRRPNVRTPAHDGLDTQASFKNYTRVVHEDNNYVYPPPEPKQPTRAPFANVTSPDEIHENRTPFRYALFRASPNGHRVNGLPSWAVPSSVPITRTNFGSTSQSKPDPVFREANFKHEDWAERLRSSGSTSPSRTTQKTRGRARTNPSTATEPMDVDMGDATSPTPQSNGVGVNDLNDLKSAGPFGSTGLNGVDDLKNNLPFESRASSNVKAEPKPSVRLRMDHLPKPPSSPIAPLDIEITAESWANYTKKMRQYMFDWRMFNRKMIEHFTARQEQLDENMAQDWISMKSDGPPGVDVDMKGGRKAGYRAYTEWLDDDKLCHNWWEAARGRHAKCVAELGHLRGVLKGQYAECEDENA